MTKTLYLHAGTDKTGTTALQFFFSRNAEALEARDIYYPKTGREENHHHHWLFAPICPFAERAGFHQPAERWREYLDQLKSEIATRPESHYLLSSELLSQEVDFTRLADLSEIFDTIKVVIYLRRQDNYLASVYQQRVKTLDCTASFDECDLPDANYLPLLESMETLARGQDNLIIRLYEAEQLHQRSIFADFMRHAFGLVVEDSYILPDMAAANPRMAIDALAFKRTANLFTPAQHANVLLGGLTAYTVEKNGQDDVFRDSELLSPEQRKRILARHEESNKTIARTYFGREDGKLFQAPASGDEADAQTYEGLTKDIALEIGSFLLDFTRNSQFLPPRQKTPILGLVECVLEEIFSEDGPDALPGPAGEREVLSESRDIQKQFNLLLRKIKYLRGHFHEKAQEDYYTWASQKFSDLERSLSNHVHDPV